MADDDHHEAPKEEGRPDQVGCLLGIVAGIAVLLFLWAIATGRIPLY